MSIVMLVMTRCIKFYTVYSYIQKYMYIIRVYCVKYDLMPKHNYHTPVCMKCSDLCPE